jgi:RNA polymerase sigma-70 factor (ECF subfamily)
MDHSSGIATSLLERAGAGDADALGSLLERYRPRLTRVISFRMDRRLRGRVDAADVVQEAYLTATTRFADYLNEKNEKRMPFFLWLRFITVQKLLELHRHHLGTKARDASREVFLFNGPLPCATSAVLAAQLLGKQSTPSQAVARDEMKVQLEAALNTMDDVDREVVALRHFEQLTNVEAARVLGINESAASNRYIRAIKRLKNILDRGR